MGNLEALKAVTAFSLLSYDIKDGVNKFGTFSVVAFGPVVSSTGLSENEVVRSEELTKRSSTDGVHGARLKIHKDSPGNITSSSSLIIVHVNSFKLKIRVTVVGTGGVNAVLVGDDLPELKLK